MPNPMEVSSPGKPVLQQGEQSCLPPPQPSSSAKPASASSSPHLLL